MIVRDIDVLAEAARRADVSVTFSVPTLDDEVWRRTEPGTAPPRQRLRALERARRRRHPRPRSGWRRSCRASPTAPSSSPRSCAPRARPARAGSGRTCSTSGRARGSTSSRASPRDWPELLPEYERLYGGARLPPRTRTRRRRETPCASSPAPHGIRDRRRTPLEPPPAAPDAALSSIALSSRTASGAPLHHTIAGSSAGRDHDPDRRRPRGRARRAPALALARAAHPRRRRGLRRRRAPSSWRSAASPTS